MDKTVIGNSGKKIAMSIYSKKKNKAHLAVLCPGFLDSKDYPHLKFLAKALASLDWQVVRFDPEGVWQSQVDISDYSTTQYLADVCQVIAYLDDLNRQAFEHIHLVGHSLGGLISLFSASNNNRIKSVVAIMPPQIQTKLRPEKLKKWKQLGYQVFKRENPKKLEETVLIKVPYQFVQDADRYQVLDIASRIKCRVLIIASDLDDLIPVSQIKQIYDSLGSKNKKMIVMENVEHTYRLKKNQIHKVNQGVVAFFDH